MGLDWQPRSVAPELASRYQRDGFWTGESLGAVLANRVIGETAARKNRLERSREYG